MGIRACAGRDGERGARRHDPLRTHPGGRCPHHHFAAMSGIQHFVIDQTVTIDFAGQGPQPWVQELLAALSGTLAAHEGTAGILCDQAPPPLTDWPGVDAVVVSTRNTLT